MVRARADTADQALKTVDCCFTAGDGSLLMHHHIVLTSYSFRHNCMGLLLAIALKLQ